MSFFSLFLPSSPSSSLLYSSLFLPDAAAEEIGFIFIFFLYIFSSLLLFSPLLSSSILSFPSRMALWQAAAAILYNSSALFFCFSIFIIDRCCLVYVIKLVKSMIFFMSKLCVCMYVCVYIYNIYIKLQLRCLISKELSLTSSLTNIVLYVEFSHIRIL